MVIRGNGVVADRRGGTRLAAVDMQGMVLDRRLRQEQGKACVLQEGQRRTGGRPRV